MPTVRDIPQEDWTEIRRRLVFYFSRRSTCLPPDDLAQETIVALLKRLDYEFDKLENYWRVVYGFAAHILLWDSRQKYKRPEELDPSLPSVSPKYGGLIESQLQIFLDEVLATAKAELSPEQYRLLMDAAETNLADKPYNFPPNEANKLRVRIHRLRKKLSDLTGLGSEEEG